MQDEGLPAHREWRADERERTHGVVCDQFLIVTGLKIGLLCSADLLQRRSKNNPLDYNREMLTVAELPEYIRRSEKLMSVPERLEIVNYLAAHPKAGELMEGTGGVRKLRWGRGAQGKSGGVRVIYYVHSELMPLYLLTLFAKNERANISKAERNELAYLVELLVQTWLKS